MERTEGKLWVELVGNAIVARIRGVPTEALIRECQAMLLSLLNDTGCKRIMYDALELDNPSTDLAVAQQTLTNALSDPEIKIAIVVGNTKVAYLSRLAFGDANHRVFYNDIGGAVAWLDAMPNESGVAPFEKRSGTA